MKTLIISTDCFLKENDDGELIRVDINQNFIVGVLEEAQERHMEVYLGVALLSSANGNLSYTGNATFIDDLLSQTRKSAERLLRICSQFRSWKGWYLPLEFWTPSYGFPLGEMPRYVKEGCNIVKQVKNIPVLVSPYINSADLNAQQIEEEFTNILLKAKVDIVALQDGVGARSIDSASLGTEVTPWLNATILACRTAKVELWLNVESFRMDEGARVPATMTDFQAQLDIVSACKLPAVTFEFGRYWINRRASPNTLYKRYRELYGSPRASQ